MKHLLKEAAQDWLTLDSWVGHLPEPEVRIAVSNKRAYSTGLCTQWQGFFMMAGNPDLYVRRRGEWELARKFAGEDDRRNWLLTNPLGTVCEAHAVLLHELTHWALFDLLDHHLHDRLFKQMLMNAGEEVVGRRFGKDVDQMTYHEVTDTVAVELFREMV